MRSGVHVDEVIVCVGLGSGPATSRLLDVVARDAGYQAAQVGPDRIQFARTIHPTWAIVTGICCLPLALVGIVFFFVTTTETCVALVEEDHRGTHVRVVGRIDRDVLARLRAVLADPSFVAPVAAPLATPAPHLPQPAPHLPPPAPTPAPPSAAQVPPPAPAPAPAPAAQLSPPAPAPAPAAPPVHPPAPPVPTGAWVELDDGRQIPLDGIVLVGRDPAAAQGEPAPAALVKVEDHDRSVSKTHLSIGVDGGQVWLTDRHSTNGTVVVEPSGAERRVSPGVREPLMLPVWVRFGARWLRVVPVAGGQGGAG